MAQIFISWSGETSRKVARALRDWLPDIFQQIEVWMSENDIEAGSRWSTELAGRLDKSQFGILCITRENQQSPWLLFEAGSLAKTIKIARVVPYLLHLSPTDIRFPLAQFQSVEATKTGTLKLIRSINEAAKLNLPPERLDKYFSKWWPDLERVLSTLNETTEPKSPTRTDRELLEEILALTRSSSLGSISHLGRSYEDRDYVQVNVQTFFPHGPRASRLAIGSDTDVSRFLDTIYFLLNEYGDVPAFEYGRIWLLKDEQSGKVFDDIGIEYCESRGQLPDERDLCSVGIKPFSKLAVIPVDRTQANKSLNRSGG